MKTIFHKICYVGVYLFFFGCIHAPLLAQANRDFDLSTLQRPALFNNQVIKSLISIAPDDQNVSLTRTNNGLVMEPTPLDASIKKSQLWWLVQDYIHNAFALVSVTNSTDWLFLEPNNSGYALTARTNDLIENEYIDNNYFFEFVMPQGAPRDKSYSIQSIAEENQYWKTQNNQILSEAITIDNEKPFIFNFRTFVSFEDQFIPVPIYNSDFHTVETTENEITGSKYTHIAVNPTLSTIDDNTALLGSGNITILKRGGAQDQFKITFEQNSIAKVGLLDYKVSRYTKEALQSPGSRKVYAGIEMNDDGEIYLFNKGIEKYTTFTADTPIIFGYDNGTLIAKQNDKSYTLTGVPTPILLNGDYYSRLVTLARKGSVQLSYKPQSILISGEDFGEITERKLHSTDPQFSYAPGNNTTNSFDWRQRTYPIAFENQGTPSTIFPLSPFYTTNDLDLYPIASKSSPRGTYLGGEDFSAIDGWELIQMDFGYDQNGIQKEDLRGEPYMVMYNRYTGTLRVFLYIHNSTIANNLRVSLVDKQTQTISGKYHQPRLWSSYLQGKALDNSTLGSEAYSKSVRLFNTSESKFYYVDFVFNYDPCTCFFESNLQIKVDKVTQGTMEIIGKTLGGTIPAGADSYGQWMENSGTYLTGVLDAPFGEQSQTIGDISLKSLDEWENTPWSNETDLVIPGRKVPDWEREALTMQYEGTRRMSHGDAISAAGKTVKALGDFVDAADGPTEAGGGKFFKGLGEMADAIGTGIKGNGRATVANAIKFRLDNLSDEPDQTTTLSFPPPQPSMVFAELAAKGSLNIETPVFDNVVITTPGSKNSELAPIEFSNNSKGAFPYYNEPLGVFNLLYTPQIGISMVQNSQNKFGAHLRLKESPYITLNTNMHEDRRLSFFTVNYVVTTYDTNGYSVRSERTKPYIISNRSTELDKQLPTSLDITNIIDQKTILQNMSTSSVDIAEALKKWVSVTLEFDFMALSGVGESGKQNGELIRQSYDAITDFSYEEVDVLTPDLNQTATNKAIADFPEYNGRDHTTWGTNYIITKNTTGFETHMKSFCEQTVPSSNTRNRLAGKGKVQKETTNSVLDEQLLEEIETNGFTTFPNPSIDYFNVRYTPLDKGKIAMTVTDMSGRVMLSHYDFAFDKNQTKEARIDLQNLNGFYLLNIKFENGESYTTKLIKEN